MENSKPIQPERRPLLIVRLWRSLPVILRAIIVGELVGINRRRPARAGHCRKSTHLPSPALASGRDSDLALVVLVVPERSRMAEAHCRNATARSARWSGTWQSMDLGTYRRCVRDFEHAGTSSYDREARERSARSF